VLANHLALHCSSNTFSASARRFCVSSSNNICAVGKEKRKEVVVVS
jgi:hypothetical protein